MKVTLSNGLYYIKRRRAKPARPVIDLVSLSSIRINLFILCPLYAIAATGRLKFCLSLYIRFPWGGSISCISCLSRRDRGHCAPLFVLSATWAQAEKRRQSNYPPQIWRVLSDNSLFRSDFLSLWLSPKAAHRQPLDSPTLRLNQFAPWQFPELLSNTSGPAASPPSY